MIKKLLYGLLALVVLVCVAGAVVWQVKGEQW